ncbi:hypothetical protein WN51_05483 [Melipona quadrifasciata]|uniref:Uncharacterized protein n=1 Tax=Melipona quadrifasciata TaxID=166423 RepID=A0A0N1IU63_9HYME|nr:hypothetical protein WN51_05483 [Melipona quadrifasciata]
MSVEQGKRLQARTSFTEALYLQPFLFPAVGKSWQRRKRFSREGFFAESEGASSTGSFKTPGSRGAMVLVTGATATRTTNRTLGTSANPANAKAWNFVPLELEPRRMRNGGKFTFSLAICPFHHGPCRIQNFACYFGEISIPLKIHSQSNRRPQPAVGPTNSIRAAKFQKPQNRRSAKCIYATNPPREEDERATLGVYAGSSVSFPAGLALFEDFQTPLAEGPGDQPQWETFFFGGVKRKAITKEGCALTVVLAAPLFTWTFCRPPTPAFEYPMDNSGARSPVASRRLTATGDAMETRPIASLNIQNCFISWLSSDMTLLTKMYSKQHESTRKHHKASRNPRTPKFGRLDLREYEQRAHFENKKAKSFETFQISSA